ncbi:MAG: alpha/beta hydrolase [Polyangiales bacterium]
MVTGELVAIDGVRSFVHDSGLRTQSEAVVFVHGNPGPMDDWESLLPPVSRFARVVAMDLPGYGRADHPRDFDFTVEGYARYLGKLLDGLGVKRVHLVLHDFGGPFGLAWAAAHRVHVASLTLINTGVLQGFKWHKYARVWQTPLLGELFMLFTSAQTMKPLVDADQPKPLPPGFYENALKYTDKLSKRGVLALYRSTRDVEGVFGPLGAALKGLDVPVCVVWGAGDPYIPVALAARQREFFPQAEVHELPGAGHWPMHDDPDALHALVVPFLERAHRRPHAQLVR